MAFFRSNQEDTARRVGRRGQGRRDGFASASKEVASRTSGIHDQQQRSETELGGQGKPCWKQSTGSRNTASATKCNQRWKIDEAIANPTTEPKRGHHLSHWKHRSDTVGCWVLPTFAED
jgi:hypothetical protein